LHTSDEAPNTAELVITDASGNMHRQNTHIC